MFLIKWDPSLKGFVTLCREVTLEALDSIDIYKTNIISKALRIQFTIHLTQRTYLHT